MTTECLRRTNNNKICKSSRNSCVSFTFRKKNTYKQKQKKKSINVRLETPLITSIDFIITNCSRNGHFVYDTYSVVTRDECAYILFFRSLYDKYACSVRLGGVRKNSRSSFFSVLNRYKHLCFFFFCSITGTIRH